MQAPAAGGFSTKRGFIGWMKRGLLEGSEAGRDGPPGRPPSLPCDEPLRPASSFFLSAVFMRARNADFALEVESVVGSSRSDSHSASRSFAICFIVRLDFAD